VLSLPLQKRLCFRHCLSVCLSVCLFVGNFAQKVRTGFAWNFQGRTAMGQLTNDQILVVIQITDPVPYCDTCRTCLGRGMHCPSASSLSICLSQNCKIIVFYSNVSINFFHFANAFFSFNTLFLINVHFKLTTLPCCSRKHSNVFLARQSAPIQYFFKSKSQHKFQWNYKLFYSKVSITNFFRFANAFFSFNTLFLINVHFKLTTLPCCSRKHSMSFLHGSPRLSDSIHFWK